MYIEREKKFLVHCDGVWRNMISSSMEITQGYICSDEHTSVRVRTTNTSTLTIKLGNNPAERHEFEFPIPRDEASLMLQNGCKGIIINKVRHILEINIPGEWIVDEFKGCHSGLFLAEIEYENLNSLEFPSWLIQDVTKDARYQNANLSKSSTVPKLVLTN